MQRKEDPVFSWVEFSDKATMEREKRFIELLLDHNFQRSLKEELRYLGLLTTCSFETNPLTPLQILVNRQYPEVCVSQKAILSFENFSKLVLEQLDQYPDNSIPSQNNNSLVETVFYDLGFDN